MINFRFREIMMLFYWVIVSWCLLLVCLIGVMCMNIVDDFLIIINGDSEDNFFLDNG